MAGMEIALAGAFTLGGGLMGWVYFLLMRRSLTRLREEEKPLRRFLLLALARILLFGGGVVAAMMVSIWCLAGYTLGFFAARTLLVRRLAVTFGSPAPRKQEGCHGQ